MTSDGLATIPNPDLGIGAGGRTHWNTAEHRRWGYHNLHRNVLYGLSLRARHVLALRRDIDRRIADLPAVRALTGSAVFSAMAVAPRRQAALRALRARLRAPTARTASSRSARP